MFEQNMAQHDKRAPALGAKRAPIRFLGFAPTPVSILAAGVAAVAMAGLVVALMTGQQHTYWYISRASGFVAFGLLWLSMLAGLGITSGLARFWPGMPDSYELHRFTSLLGIAFCVVHILVLIGDAYIGYTLAQLLVPFAGDNYRPEWVGFGQVAFYLLLPVSFTFYIRNRIGVHAWRLIHMLSFSLFLMSLVHGLYSGTDSATFPAQVLYWTSALTVLGGSVYRLLALRHGIARASLSPGWPVVLPSRAQMSVPPARRHTAPAGDSPLRSRAMRP